MNSQNLEQMHTEVIGKVLLKVKYEQATKQQQAAFRLLQFYNEMASGGFEGYISWVLEQLEYETPEQYIEKLVQNLLQIHSIEMANLVKQHAIAIMEASKRFTDDEINENDYIDVLAPANDQYYKAENQFHADIQLYIVQLYEAIQSGSFYENSELYIVKRASNSPIFDGISNFRDMGGVETKDGRTVKSGLLFRSGHLADASEQDIEALKNLQLQLIFDYRDTDEAERYPSPVLEHTQMIRQPAITGNNAIKTGAMEELLKPGALDKIVENFTQFYKGMIFNNPAYKALLKEFVSGKAPLLHHCTAGKDRTGIGAALMYIILGVPEQTIIEEFLLTNKANAHKLPQWYMDIVKLVGDQPQLKVLIGVSEEHLQAVFDEILKRYGSYEAYFEQEYGIKAHDIEKARSFYLQ